MPTTCSFADEPPIMSTDHEHRFTCKLFLRTHFRLAVSFTRFLSETFFSALIDILIARRLLKNGNQPNKNFLGQKFLLEKIEQNNTMKSFFLEMKNEVLNLRLHSTRSYFVVQTLFLTLFLRLVAR